MEKRTLLSKLLFYTDGTFSWTKFAALVAALMTVLLFVDYYVFDRVNEVILDWSIKIIPTLAALRPAQKMVIGGLDYVKKNGMNAITQKLDPRSRVRRRQKGEPEFVAEVPATPKPNTASKPTTKPIPVGSNKETFVLHRFPFAKKAEKEYGIDTAFTLAMAGVESGWGKSGIGNGKHNIWGIKAGKNYKGEKVLCNTQEFHDTNDKKYPVIISITPVMRDGKQMYHYKVKDYFRSYETFEGAIHDWIHNVLQGRWLKHAWGERGNAERYVKALQSGPAKYATGTRYVATISNAARDVREIIKTHKLS